MVVGAAEQSLGGDRQGDVSQLRGENVSLREQLQLLVTAHAQPELLQLAQVCTKPLCSH